MLDNTTDNTTTEIGTITVENFVDRLQNNYEMLWGLDSCIRYSVVDWRKRMYPNKEDFFDFHNMFHNMGSLEQKPLLTKLLTNFFRSSTITSDLKLLDEMDYLSETYTKISKLCDFEGSVQRPNWIDLGDELSNQFSPIFRNLMKKFIELGLGEK